MGVVQTADFRVLVVDDNRDAADSLASVLQALGYATRTAYSSREAMFALTAFSPRAVLLDIELPDMGGYDMAREIRARKLGNDPVLVAVTGWGAGKTNATQSTLVSMRI